MVRCMVSLSRLKDGGWYWTVLGAGFLERVSSCWLHVVLAVGCDSLSGGIGPASPVLPKACHVAASWSISSPVPHVCSNIGLVDMC